MKWTEAEARFQADLASREPCTPELRAAASALNRGDCAEAHRLARAEAAAQGMPEELWDVFAFELLWIWCSA